MGAIPVSRSLEVHSLFGAYHVEFGDSVLGATLEQSGRDDHHVFIDSHVLRTYSDLLDPLLKSARSVVAIEADERNKSLEKIPDYAQRLVSAGARRDHTLYSIGGGIIQDISCFVASVLFRGIAWEYIPTTLLAQADSCIGSKSSINLGESKNIIGNFYPPRRIMIAPLFLNSLDDVALRSGVGEILKVHMIAGPQAFDELSRDYDRLFSDRQCLLSYIVRSLEIKKEIIEADEFDRGLRNIMNLGHTFGHAIESATEFRVPHGIAVTLGLDMAIYAALRMGRLSEPHFLRMHPVIRKNYRGFEQTEIPLDRFFAAISRDKKNLGSTLTLILPNRDAQIERISVARDAFFESLCQDFFDGVRAK
jgi:3-dehydroquinate synthase